MAISTALPAALVATILPFEILDLLHRAVFEHEELVAVVAVGAVLELVADDAQIFKACVLDRERERGKGEVAELDLVVRQRSDDRRCALEALRFEGVGLAVVLHQIRLLQEQRRPVGRRDDPAGPDLHRFGAIRRAGGKQDGAGHHPAQGAHVSSHWLSLLRRRYHRVPGGAITAELHAFDAARVRTRLHINAIAYL